MLTLDPPPTLLGNYQQVRDFTEELSEPLATEDYVVQTMPDVSPTKWHLGHSSWFFETFLLAPNLPAFAPIDTRYAYIFNSYYEAVGDRQPRAARGLLSRPTVEEIRQYREYVDRWMERLLGDPTLDVSHLVTLGINHEQQHQELLLTDIKHVFAANPLNPVYVARDVARPASVPALGWLEYDGGIAAIGHDGQGFAFDNELPRHEQLLRPFQVASRLVTNGEFQQFIEDGGYRRPELWLSMGWGTVLEERWQAPLYWQKHGSKWWNMTLSGLREVQEAEPVCHVSYFEADAYARWSGARLPSEAEWELASLGAALDGNFVESGCLHPCPASGEGLLQMFGDVWEWTHSSYSAYPGYRSAEGAIGEYNGKFMCNQYVLRGGSCASPRSHIRATYRNFFPPEARWQFTGIRLANDG
ncbi:MAG TPA: ergothioneine biosynthesis protein EgtB [Chloroflexota bacterium]|nr:ergothioneine biosynthesis protein EgtB [Chloroflexota bacterium]